MAWSQSLCVDYLTGFLFENTNTIFFTQVEVFRQNNNIGPQQLGRLEFIKWVDFTLEFGHETASSVIGLTKSGRMYHLIKSPERTIARLLNGELIFADFKMTSNGEVVAKNQQGKTYVYLPHLWETSPRKAVTKQGAYYWGLASVVGITTKFALLGPGYGVPLEISSFNLMIPLIETMTVGAAGLNTALVMANKYYHRITFPNGFIPVELSYDRPLNMIGELREMRSQFKEGTPHPRDHFLPPDFGRLDPALPKELTEDIQ